MWSRWALMALVWVVAWAGESQATHEQIAAPQNIKIGALGLRYFSASELARVLGGDVKRDLDQVKYLAELDLNFLALGIASPLAVDAIPSIDAPRFLTPAESDAWLADDQLVLGVNFNGIARAYPLAILNWHELVNDVFDGVGVVITYCPLCDSGLAFLAPEIDGQVAAFGVSGRLFLSDLVMYDRATATFWEQFQGRPIVGPLVGQAGRLHRIPTDIVPYGLWKAQHPNTQVLERPRLGDALGNQRPSPTRGELLARDYARDPYARYRATNPQAGGQTALGVPFNDDRLAAKAQVVGLTVAGVAKAYAREALEARGLLNDVVGGVPVLLVRTPAGELKAFERTVEGAALTFALEDGALRDDRGDLWNFAGEAQSGPLAGARLAELLATPSFWFAWVAFNPNTELYTGAQSSV